MIITMVLSYNGSLHRQFFCLRVFSASWRNILQGFWGLRPKLSPGLCPWTSLGTEVPRPPASILPKTKFWIRPWHRLANMAIHAGRRPGTSATPAKMTVDQHTVGAGKSIPEPTCSRPQTGESTPVQVWNSPQGGQVHHTPVGSRAWSIEWYVTFPMNLSDISMSRYSSTSKSAKMVQGRAVLTIVDE